MISSLYCLSWIDVFFEILSESHIFQVLVLSLLSLFPLISTIPGWLSVILLSHAGRSLVLFSKYVLQGVRCQDQANGRGV